MTAEPEPDPSRALADSGSAALTPADLALALGLDAEAATPLFVAALAAGRLDAWAHPAVLLLTLSPLQAERLGVRLADPSRDGAPTWKLAGEPDRASPRAFPVRRSFPSRDWIDRLASVDNADSKF